MRSRLPLIISATALLVALLGSTPLGRAAADAVAQKVVPRAKTATFAVNAGKLNGHRSAVTPRVGQIPVVGSDGKLAASIGAVGPVGPVGPAGPQGPAGIGGYQQIQEARSAPSGNDEVRSYEVPQNGCPGSKSVMAGGYTIRGEGSQHLDVLESRPLNASRWRVRIRNFTGQQAGSVDLYAICANVSS